MGVLININLWGSIMNLKSISIFLVVFFLAIAAVSAADENITDDSLLTVAGDSEDLSVSINDNVSLSGSDDDCLSVSSDNVSLAAAGEDCLSVSDDNVSLSAGVDDCLTVSSDNVSLASVNELPVSVSVESSLAAPESQSKLSMPTDPDDSKLTSSSDVAYSKKQWKAVWLVSVKLKYTWSEKKMKKVLKQELIKNKKKINKIEKKYTKKGWNFKKVYYKIKYGKKLAKCKYYVQLYRTVHYNDNGEVLYVD